MAFSVIASLSQNLYRKQNYLTMCTGPLMCCIDRLDVQKGYDILLEALM
eukprot:s4367_g1.t1